MGILNAMLFHIDPKTGKQMGQDNIMYNTLSLFGAGHTGVGSLLAWTIIMLVKHPRCMEKLRQELEEVLQGGRITKIHVHQLPYLTACIRETLRFYPATPAHSIVLREDAPAGMHEGLGGQNYYITRADVIRVNLLAIQQDPEVYGDDAEQFKPERMLESNFSKFPRNSWKPFGTGVRICIGRFFALQEALIVVATLVQSFDFDLVDDRCGFRVGESLILLPVDCAMKVKRRDEVSSVFSAEGK